MSPHEIVITGRRHGKTRAMQTEYFLRRYLASTRIRRDLASIMGDADGEIDAKDAEADGRLALSMAQAGVW